MTCSFVQVVPPDLDPSSCRIPVVVKNTHVVVITVSPIRSILDYGLFSLSFLDVYALSSLWNLFLRVDIGLLVSSLDLIFCGVCLDKVQ